MKGHRSRKDRENRDDLAGEHRLGDAGQLVLAVLFLVTWIADSFVLKLTTFLNPTVPLFVRIPIGLVLFVLAGYLSRRSMSLVFGEKREIPRVIREGVFSIIRHPMYLSEILLYLGLLMMSLSLIAALVWAVAIGFLHYISRHEEKLLLGRFGEEYERYMRNVPMWIPRPWKK
jgi:protein-S-isoprenylcysteine O-methyltransferase Ste14